jgi:hypothetical protein
MSKHTRALVLGVTLAAMNLAGLTAVAQAQTSHYPASNQDPRRPAIERHVGQPYRNYPASNQGPRRPATEGQVREPYRYYHDTLAAQAQRAQDDAVERFRGERAALEQPTTDATQRELAERWNYYYQATRMSPAELKAWMEAKQRAHNPTPVPAPLPPDQPTGQPGWLVLTLGVVSAALAVVAGLAVLAARRASRRLRSGHAA